MDVESTFRVMFGVKKEQDMVELIEAAVSVASLIAPNKLKKHRSRIVKLLFDEDPANASHDLFSDDELGFDSDDDDEELLKVTSTPAKKTSNSPEIKKLGFKKCGEESQVVAPQMTPLKMEGRQEKSMEAPKKMLGRKSESANHVMLGPFGKQETKNLEKHHINSRTIRRSTFWRNWDGLKRMRMVIIAALCTPWKGKLLGSRSFREALSWIKQLNYTQSRNGCCNVLMRLVKEFMM
nr:hypothetical protein DM860_006244 [Ipomoea batatas]